LTVDVAANRRAVKYDRAELLGRALWALAGPLFRWSPRPLFAWRRGLLRLFGATVGAHVHVYPSTRIFLPWNLEIGDWSSVGPDTLIYNLGRVRLGRRVTISYRAHLCAGTHDYRRPDMRLLKPPISIGDDAWVCTDAFIGPDVTVGEGAVVGACAAVIHDVPPWRIVAGNPARAVGTRTLDEPPVGVDSPGRAQ
jgi:putative colanic acid biosynthesis acetyltransferase WcaF